MSDNIRRVIEADKQRNRAKRFYKTVGVGGDAAPYAITLDDRAIRTPMKATLEVPTRALAEAVAAEWREQGEYIDPPGMRITRLCNTAIDRVGGSRQRIIEEIAGFAGSDLVCYRAEQPEALVVRQNDAWDPLLQFMSRQVGARLISATGIIHHEQSEAALNAVSGYLDGQDDYALTAIHNMTTLTGSCVIAIAVHHGEVGGEDAWAAAHVDEDWQIEQWGEDEEARVRRAGNRLDFDAALRLLELARTTG